MEINLSWEEMRKRKLFIATPMYGGMCTGHYMKSMLELISYCTANQMHCKTSFLFNESLITRARNYLTDEFLRSDCTHMMFIDSDIGFETNDVMTLLALQGDESPYDVISAPYPKKVISWEKVKCAVDKGAADEDPNALANYVGDFVFNPIQKEGAYEVRLDEPVEISEAGTGFMMIRRETLIKYMEAYPEQLYIPDSYRDEMFDGSHEITAFFDCIIDPKSRRYLSEDYMFCHKVREMGLTVWMCPWMHLIHHGTYAFGGSLPYLASIGADATAGGMIKKVKK